MKNLVILVALLIVLSSGVFSQSSSVTIKHWAFTPRWDINRSGETFVSVREFAEGVGASIDYQILNHNDAAGYPHQISITVNKKEITCWLNCTIYRTADLSKQGNWEFHDFTSPPYEINGVSYLPLRTIAESCGTTVDYDFLTSRVVVEIPVYTTNTYTITHSKVVVTYPEYKSYSNSQVVLSNPDICTNTETVTPTHRVSSKRYYSPTVAENGSYYGEVSRNTGRPKDVYVHSYCRRDGTYVRSHYRSSPSR